MQERRPTQPPVAVSPDDDSGSALSSGLGSEPGSETTGLGGQTAEATGIPGPRMAPGPQAVGHGDHGPVAAEQNQWSSDDQDRWPRVAAPALSTTDFADAGTADKLAASAGAADSAIADTVTDPAIDTIADDSAAPTHRRTRTDAADSAIAAPATDPLVDTSADPSVAPTHRRSRTGAATAAPTRRRARTATGRPASRSSTTAGTRLPGTAADTHAPATASTRVPGTAAGAHAPGTAGPRVPGTAADTHDPGTASTRLPATAAALTTRLPRPARAPAAIAAAWLGVLLAHLLHADLAVLAAIVLGTAALSRYGSTLLDRVMAALVLLAAGGIVGGLVISYWPWGLSPVAVGGSALSALVGVKVLTGRAFRLPVRVPAADVIAVSSGVAALLVAAWPTLHTDYWKRFMYSALLADRVRQFAMFDVVRSGHSYAFAHFDRVSSSALPGARSYPSGMQMIYSIVDCFAHGDGAPGDPVDEFNRYYWYTLISFGLLVLAVVWAARRIAGPLAITTHRLPAVFVTSGIGAFLATGYFLSYVWQGFDSVVFASVFLVAGMAVALRPPRSVLEHALLAGSAFLAVVYGHPLLLPHITLILLAALVVYRTRFLKVLKGGKFGLLVPSIGLTVLVAVPLLALSGLSIGTRFRTDGFIIALPRHLVVTVAALALVALANPAARRLPAARAALAAIAAVGLVQLALASGLIDVGGASSSAGAGSSGGTHYYVEKSLNGFVLLALVGVGGLSTLWPRRGPARPNTRPRLVRQAEAFTTTVLTAGVAVLAVGALAFSPAYLNWSRYQPGADSTWAELWTSGHTFIADYGHQLKAQKKAGVFTSGRPVIVAASGAGVLNLNMSLFAGAMNRDLHSVSSQVNRTSSLSGLTGLPAHGEWSPQAKASLKALEHIITSNPTPVLVVVSDKVLAAKLAEFAAANPGHRFDVEYIP